MEGWWVAGRARGWAEVALEDLVARVVAEQGLDLGGGGAAITVEPARAGARGAFRVDLRGAGGQGDLTTVCRDLATALERHADNVASAVPAPPAVFLTPTVAFLVREVADAVVHRSPFPPRPAAAEPPFLAFTYNDPNMNKPLHLGHFRNIVIGMSITRLLEAQGSKVDAQALHSDWGIHVAQAVAGYLRWGDGATPESAAAKSDHFVGRFYARFHQENARQREAAGAAGGDDGGDTGDAEPTELEREAAALLRRMQASDEGAIRVNRMVTDWVEAGVAATYDRVGCVLDHIWRERETTSLGVDAVRAAVERGRCVTREDTSVYLDLSDRGLSPVTLLRSDGTPVVHVQWLGVDLARYPNSGFDHILQMSGQEWAPGEIVYTEVARELGGDWVGRWTHFYYGMVTLAGGKMSSRAAGSTVLVDDLLDELADWFGRDCEDRAACEFAALALARFHYLTPKRLKDVVHDHDVLVGRTRATLARVLSALAAAEAGSSADGAGTAGAGADAAATEALLLQLNGFARLAQTAAQRLEPEYVVSYLVETGGAVDACLRAGGLDASTAAAAAVVLRAAFRLLHIDLPEQLSTLPPTLLDRIRTE